MSVSKYPPFSTAQILLLGLRCRCPRCGIGGLFYKYLKISDECPKCHLGFQGHDTGDAAVVPAILILGSIVMGMALYLELSVGPPVWVHMAIWTPVITISTAMILPPLKGLTIALQYKFRDTEEIGRPGGS